MTTPVKTLKKAARKQLDKLIAIFLPKRLNQRVSSSNGLWNHYFTLAEDAIDHQWDTMIWPVIKDFDFDTVLELAPGAGRNTEKLAQLAGTIHAVDLNEYAIEQTRQRFQNYTGDCKLYFHTNDGSDLGMIKDNTITCVYCWDSAVHFDKEIIRDYVKEFARVLKAGGMGFIHHSNLGASANGDIRKNPHWRSNMSKELFEEYCKENALELVSQTDLPWGKITDCISVFQKARPSVTN